MPRLERRQEAEGRLPAITRVDEKQKQTHLTEAGHEQVEQLMLEAGLLREGESLYDPAEHPADASPERGPARACDLQARRRIHRAQRRSDHRRRIHRPHDAGPALVRRPAPGGRGEGRREGARGKPDRRVDHLPELLPPVQETLRHDRHGGHGSPRVHPDLQSRSGRDPDASSDDPQGQRRLRLSHAERQVQGDHRGHRGLRAARAARAGRHHVDRNLGAALRRAAANTASRTKC